MQANREITFYSATVAQLQSLLKPSQRGISLEAGGYPKGLLTYKDNDGDFVLSATQKRYDQNLLQWVLYDNEFGNVSTLIATVTGLKEAAMPSPITISEVGNLTLSGAYTAVSIIGALNEVMAKTVNPGLYWSDGSGSDTLIPIAAYDYVNVKKGISDDFATKIPIGEAGNTALDPSFSAISIIGALNELLSSGASTIYSNATPMYISLGGYEIGDTFTNQTMQQMWDGLLYPFQYPTFSSFYFSGWATTLEVGASTSINPTAIWSTTNSGNVAVNSISIRDVTGSTDIATGLANDGTEALTYGAVTKRSPSSNVFRITGTNTKTPSSSNFTRDFTVNWYWRVYAGTSASTSLTEAQIEALTDFTSLVSGFARNYSLSAGNYKYICYPSSMGLATVFKDTGSGLDVAMSPTVPLVSVTNAQGQTTSYRVHRTSFPIVGAITIAVS